MVEALVHAVVTAGSRDVDTSGMDRHTVVLHATVDELADAAVVARDGDVVVQDVHGRPLPMSARLLRRLACEAGISLVALAHDGDPIDGGRRRRALTTAQRRALQTRDRSCRFPGCGSTRHLHAHHIVHWADGGATDLDNLVLVCAHHHRFVHDRGWQVTRSGPGTFRFAPPGGDAVPTAVPAATVDDVIDVVIDPDSGRRLSASDRWGHDDLDLDIAIAVLHQELSRWVDPATATAA